ncbi:hypothetical protein P152DRAFT_458802 [Eremomyces bilateralis CBS 781.70]|uniref:Uncharacterized protein n=1 Tax=Eremomyces bilateralis CBS 781.70 TaxID=1392243 RepID=A0A6G1G2T6_9PEZI|nr:uncharacterized protein P152DRAFT_458802 [Eremomyces bilateralis CBS 781.70]KAF1812427.1 hypothetical protein P152DRAFT_458802 [Eremomyces bilateralis CBS 781.70]
MANTAAGIDPALSGSHAGAEDDEPGLPPEDFQSYLRNPKKRVRAKRHHHAEAVSEDNARVAKLSRSTRWNHFFFHCCFKENKLIQNVYGSVTADDVEWREAHDFIHACYVKRLIEEDTVAASIAVDKFTKFIESESVFSSVNFFNVFGYMHEYLDYDGSSTSGKWYCRSVFANLAGEVRRWIEDGKDENARQRLLQFYDEMVAYEAYTPYKRKDLFKEAFVRTVRSKKAKTPRDMTVSHSRMVVSAPPPFPSLPSPTSSSGGAHTGESLFI